MAHSPHLPEDRYKSSGSAAQAAHPGGITANVRHSPWRTPIASLISVSDIETIEEIYDAVGDVERWRHLNERLASARGLSPEIEWHLAVGREAHEQQVRLHGEIETLITVHDQLTIGAIVVDSDGRVLRSNAAASRHLANRAGLRLVDGHLEAIQTNEKAALHEAIECASSASRDAAQNPFVTITREDGPPVSLVVIRAHREPLHVFEDSRPVAILLIDPELTTPPGEDVLRRLFGFTAREAELAAILLKGGSLDDAARALGVARSTARTFLAHVTAKTESHSQSELMRRLLVIPHVT
jgi:DNA-binding CsgD family transcriptional regulator